MSLSEPRETTLEKPTLLGSAQSRIAVQSAPDCDMRPMVPGLALPWAKVRLSWLPGRMMPRQLGPIRRMPWRRAFSSAARSSAPPRGPASANPPEMMMAFLQPERPQVSTISGTVSARVQITAMSSRCGMVSTEA
jgi:hypothetical protein